MRFWQSLRYIEREREAALLFGLTTRCSGRTRAADAERYAHFFR